MTQKQPIAFFCSEYALTDNPAMYAGGLGVLSADYLLELAEEKIPFFAVGIKYRGFDDKEYEKQNFTLDIPVGEKNIKTAVWTKKFGQESSLSLLDADIEENSEADRLITANLYDTDFKTRLKQQIILGVGGVRLIKKMGIKPSIYHLNEGHTAFAALGILAELPEDADKIVTTKHTILHEAGLYVPREELAEEIGRYCKETETDFNAVFEKGKYELDDNIFSTTKFALNSAIRKNAVSKKHAEYEKITHPESSLIPITNGIYLKRWKSPLWNNLSDNSSHEKIRETKRALRTRFVSLIFEKTGKKLNPDFCTIVWARRFAAYKRPYLLFENIEKIKKIVSNKKHPIQIVVSGKAHPADQNGQDTARKILEMSNNPSFEGRLAYLPDYSLSSAEILATGADVWLNTPEKGKEACGTSGMKAGANGGLLMSVADGWVEENEWKKTGWIIPPETKEASDFICETIEKEIAPLFYGNSPEWVEKMKETMGIIENKYSAGRMIKDYFKKIYFPEFPKCDILSSDVAYF